MAQIDLFTTRVPPEEQHPNYKNIVLPSMAAERAQLAHWAEGFPDRDHKLAREFQTTFNSSFWEIYLHALFQTYGFSMDWTHASPDFHVVSPYGDFIVEASTANAAKGKTAEWERHEPLGQAVIEQDFWPLNKEAMIRLSNTILGKARAYETKYSKLGHVRLKPFVVAVAPFEQPDFQYQYDRPIRALLYDYYIDEAAYRKDPNLYPNGPPGVKLGFVEKDNGAEVPLGIFLNEQYREISAVIFSCTATWGKVDVLAKDSKNFCTVHATWGGDPDGSIHATARLRSDHVETLEDGLQIFHNPHAVRPLDPRVFRRSGVVQHYFDSATQEWVHEEKNHCLHFRLVQALRIHDDDDPTFAV
jgi:hypothetical protein